MRFAFESYRSDGSLETGEIEAATRAEALRMLGDRGLIPYRTEPSSRVEIGNRSHRALPRRTSLSLPELAVLTRELAILLQAQLPIDTALRLVVSSAPASPASRLASQMLDALMSGSALSSAVHDAASGAPPIVASLLKAGEGRGNIAASMDEVASYLERRVGLTQRIKSALTYPIILALTAVVAITIIVGVLVPALMPLFEGSGRPPPAALQLAHGFTRAVAEHWLAMTVGIVSLLIVLTIVLLSPRLALARQNLLLRIPIIKDLKSHSEITTYARTLGTLLRNGVPMVQGLQNASDVLTTDRFRTATRGITELVKEGRRLTAAIEESAVFPTMAVRFIAVGEEASKLDEMLLHLASAMEQQFERRVDKLMTLLGPSMTVAIGVLVGGLVVSVMQAILSINEVALR